MKKSTVIYVAACVLSGFSCLLSYIAGIDDGMLNGINLCSDLNKTVTKKNDKVADVKKD